MRVDVHTHIFPPKIIGDRSPLFPNEPVFKMLYGSPKARMVDGQGLIDAMDRDEVECAVVFGFPWQERETTVRHNDYVLEAALKYHPRLIPLSCVNPLSPFALEEAKRCLRSGARGLGELAIYTDCEKDVALRALEELIQCCREHDGILLLHANEPVGHVYPGKAPQGLDLYYAVARLASGIPLILAHWGGGLCFYELLKKEAPEVLAQVYYDTAASPFLYQPSIYAHMARVLGKEKILFGSDYPLLPPSRYFQEMSDAQLTNEELRSITGENAARLFRLNSTR